MSIERYEFQNSSQLIAGRYDTVKCVMVLTFRDASYEYNGVPENVWDGLCRAESAGSYLARNVKPKYHGKKL